jgi:hypothetical protein
MAFFIAQRGGRLATVVVVVLPSSLSLYVTPFTCAVHNVAYSLPYVALRCPERGEGLATGVFVVQPPSSL